MQDIPDDVWELSELTREFGDATDEYEQQLAFYKDHVQDFDELSKRPEFDSEYEAGEYWREVRDDLEETAERVQELGRQLHLARREFNPEDYSVEPFREIQGIDYEGPEQLVEHIERTYRKLGRLEGSTRMHRIHQDLTVDPGKMRDSPMQRELREELREEVDKRTPEENKLEGMSKEGYTDNDESDFEEEKILDQDSEPSEEHKIDVSNEEQSWNDLDKDLADSLEDDGLGIDSFRYGIDEEDFSNLN